MNKNRTIKTASTALFAIIGVVLMANTTTAASVSNGDIHVANGAASFSITSDPITVQRGDYVYLSEYKSELRSQHDYYEVTGTVYCYYPALSATGDDFTVAVNEIIYPEQLQFANWGGCVCDYPGTMKMIAEITVESYDSSGSLTSSQTFSKEFDIVVTL